MGTRDRYHLFKLGFPYLYFRHLFIICRGVFAWYLYKLYWKLVSVRDTEEMYWFHVNDGVQSKKQGSELNGYRLSRFWKPSWRVSNRVRNYSVCMRILCRVIFVKRLFWLICNDAFSSAHIARRKDMYRECYKAISAPLLSGGILKILFVCSSQEERSACIRGPRCRITSHRLSSTTQRISVSQWFEEG